MTVSDDGSLRSIVAFRTLVGLLVFRQFADLYGQSAFLLSDSGWITRAEVIKYLSQPALSLFFVSGDVLYVKALVALGMIAGVAMSFGVSPRVMALMAFVLQSSMYHRAGWILYGADQAIHVFCFFLLFIPSERSKKSNSPRSTFVVRLLRLQIIFIYFSAGFWKLHGMEWWNGEALLRMHQLDLLTGPEFLTTALLRHASFNKAVHWLIVIGELSFGLFVNLKSTRRVVLLTGILLHLMTIVFMRVDAFGWVMLSSYPIFLLPEDWQLINRWKVAVLKLGENRCRDFKSWIFNLTLKS